MQMNITRHYSAADIDNISVFFINNMLVKMTFHYEKP